MDEVSLVLLSLMDWVRMYGKEGRTVITIIGSTKYREEIKKLAWELTKKRFLVLFAPFAKEEIPELEQYRDELEIQHKQKIRMADMVFVYNKGDKLGEQTSEELRYAQNLNKPTMFLDNMLKIGETL